MEPRGDSEQVPRMTRHLRRLQRTAVPHIEAFRTTLNHPFELARNRPRIILEWRTDRSACEGDAADQNARCDQIANLDVLR